MAIKPVKNNKPSSIISILIVALLISVLYSIWNKSGTSVPDVQVTKTQFITDVKTGTVSKVEVTDKRIDYTLSDGTEKFTFFEPGETTSEILKEVDPAIRNTLSIEVVDTSSSDIWWNIGLSLIPFLLIVGFFLFMMRGAASSNNQAMSFGRSNAKLHDKENGKTTFKDVAGVKEAKEELVEIVDFLKHPSKYTAMGAKIPKGVVLVGGPGTGKTLLARAVAARRSFLQHSGSELLRCCGSRSQPCSRPFQESKTKRTLYYFYR
jgi:cell division protease FtsH